VSELAVAAFHEPRLARGAAEVEAVVWVRASHIEPGGVTVSLRVWTPAGAAVTALREVAPSTSDLLGTGARLDERTVRFDAGRWSDGVHEYELAVALPARATGEEMLAARIDVIAGGERAGGALVAVTWTDDALDDSAPGAPDGPADLPTGASPEPRHSRRGLAEAVGACVACGELPEEGDRYCEACGHELG
jgi:hypothetical protein